MSSSEEIVAHVDSHLSQVNETTKEQNQEVSLLIEKNMKDIEEFNALNSNKDLDEQVSETMKSISDVLDTALKDINEQLGKIQRSTS